MAGKARGKAKKPAASKVPEAASDQNVQNDEVEDNEMSVEYLVNDIKVKQAAVAKSKSGKAATVKHYELSAAVATYEDFLHYQNVLHRQNRVSVLQNPRENDSSSPDPVLWKRGGLWDYGNSVGSITYLADLLDRYDKTGIGIYEHRRGMGHFQPLQKRGKKGEHTKKRVGPDELHLWTPPPRYPPVGLRDEDEQPHILSMAEFELNLDEIAIEAKRERVEAKKLTPVKEGGKSLLYKTHSERRAAERELRESWRPTTSSIRGSDPGVYKDCFRHLQSAAGVFISAKESSYDWLTSYDCLGKIENNRTIRATRQASESEASNGHEKPQGRNILEDGGKGTRLRLGAATRLQTKRATRSAAKPPEKAPKKNDNMQKDYDYDYPDNEFIRPPNKQKLYEHEQTSDLWEATTGRREWHISRRVVEVSPPTSPPIAPRSHKTDMESALQGIPEKDVAFCRPRRCQHKNRRCRATWIHTIQECWEADLEPLAKQTDDNPAEPAKASKKKRKYAGRYILPIPQNSLEIYRNRLQDHYGRLEGTNETCWPRIGVRVPYSPTTVIDKYGILPVHEDATSYHREQAITSVRSMAVPIISTFVNPPRLENTDQGRDPVLRPADTLRPSSETPEGPTVVIVPETSQWDSSIRDRHRGWTKEQLDEIPPSPESPGSSEDETDLFRRAYLTAL